MVISLRVDERAARRTAHRRLSGPGLRHHACLGWLALGDRPLGYRLERLASVRRKTEVCQGDREPRSFRW